MNNGIFVQDSYDGKVSFESQSIKGLLGNPTLVPLPYSCSFNRWDPNKLVYVIDTRLQSSTTITFSTSNLIYTIDWGDGYIESIRATSAYFVVRHTYATHGSYIIQTDNVNNPLIGGSSLIAILSFGTFPSNLNLIYDGGGTGSFSNSSNLLFVPSNLPPHNSLDLGIALNNAFKLNDQNISLWDTSKVTTMRFLFQNNRFLNQPLNYWNTSNVTSMQGMFGGALSFNQDLNNWNVRKVTIFDGMFTGATNFNGSLSGWALGADTAGTSCSSMFNVATSFNQDLSSWDVSKVTNFSSMFNGARSFNQSLNGWQLVSSGVNCSSMFFNAINFNQNLGTWNTSGITNVSSMFNTATSFTGQGIDSWTLPSVTTASNMFINCFNLAPTGSLSGWGMGSCTDMTRMFYSAGNSVGSNFSGLNSWNTSSCTNMSEMFFNSRFNNSLSNWDVSKVTTFSGMFQSALDFNQPLSNWNIAGINVNTGLDNFMNGKTGANAYSTANYDALLIGWNNNKLVGANNVANWRTDLRPNFGGARYTAGGAAATARAALVSYGWTITDGGVA